VGTSERANLEEAARSLLERLAGTDPPAGAVTVTAAGWRLTLRAERPRPLTPCEQDILAVLAECTTRWATTRVLSELDRRGMIHGETTVKLALARLVKLGLIRNSRKAPRGYWRESAATAASAG
jgi:hypothetical protein